MGTKHPDARIIERIRKVLAMTTSPNQNEAAVAAAKAQEMLLEYNLEIEQVAGMEEAKNGASGLEVIEERLQYVSSKFSPLKTWKEQLANRVTQHTECRILIWNKTHLGFYGVRHNVETSVNLYKWLVQQLEVGAAAGWTDYVDGLLPGERRDDPLVYRASFFAEAVREIGRRMVERRREQERQHGGAVTALVIRHGEAIEVYFQRFNLGKSASRQGSKFNAHGSKAGWAAGSRANLGDRNVGSGRKALR